MVHGRRAGGRAKVHVVQIVQVGRAAVGLIAAATVGGGRLDDGTAANRRGGAGARESGRRGRARGYGEVAVGRVADRGTVADRRRVTGLCATVRI